MTDPARPGFAGRFPLVVRSAPMLGGVVLTLLVISLARRPFRSFDTYFHLRFGENFLGGWSIRNPGQPSSASTNDWVPTQWLPQMGLAKVEDVAGTTGLVIVFAVLCTALTASAYLLLRRSTSAGIAVTLVLLVLLGTLPALSLRPQVLSYLFLVLLLMGWDAARRSGRAPWWQVPFAWLWAVSHGMWILGLGASGLLAIAVCLERRPPRKATLQLLAVPVAMVVATCLTPAGPRLVTSVLLVNSRAEYFNEWRAPELASFAVAPITVLLTLALVLLARRNGVAFYDVALGLMGLAFAVYSNRTLPLAAIVLATLVAHLSRASMDAPKDERPGLPRPERVLVAGLAALVVVIAPLLPRLDDPAEEIGAFESRLAALPAGTTLITDPEAGGILLWREPQLDIPIHGYGDVYTDDEIESYYAMARAKPGWEETVAALGAQAALLLDDSPLASALEADGWTLEESAEGRVLLTAPAG